MLLGVWLAACIAPVATQAQFIAQGPSAAVGEAHDFGVAPSAELRLKDFSAPTPLEIPGARIITTAELRRLLREGQPPVLLDVIAGEGHASLPGAIWLPGAGRGSSFEDDIQARLAVALQAATKSDTGAPLVFLCAGPRCWLSYNAALRAVRLGYSDVRWYRGGIEAWGAGGGALTKPRLVWQRN
jgi:PQQ-dependent catabolism-associated CXXCW motif protein